MRLFGSVILTLFNKCSRWNFNKNFLWFYAIFPIQCNSLNDNNLFRNFWNPSNYLNYSHQVSSFLSRLSAIIFFSVIFIFAIHNQCHWYTIHIIFSQAFYSFNNSLIFLYVNTVAQILRWQKKKLKILMNSINVRKVWNYFSFYFSLESNI